MDQVDQAKHTEDQTEWKGWKFYPTLKVNPPLTKKPPEDGHTGVDQVDQAKYTEDQTEWWFTFIKVKNKGTANFVIKVLKLALKNSFVKFIT